MGITMKRDFTTDLKGGREAVRGVRQSRCDSDNELIPNVQPPCTMKAIETIKTWLFTQIYRYSSDIRTQILSQHCTRILYAIRKLHGYKRSTQHFHTTVNKREKIETQGRVEEPT